MLLAVGRLPVSAQSEGANELLLAAAALIGSFVVDEVLRAELLLTYVASKRLLSRVNSHMRLQIGALRETLATNLAFERLFARVEPQMGLQGGGLRETFAANFARKGPFARVNTNMFPRI